MGKKSKKRKAAQEEPPPDDPDEIEGFVEDGELYLRDANGVVYSTERDDRGALVAIGTWDSALAAVVRTPAAELTDDPSSSDVPVAPPSTPHPPPPPLTFVAAEDDHCETAPEAYAHIAGLLMLVARSVGKTAESLRIYDPYYCNGAVVRHLGALGFANVYNKNEDFYAVIADGKLPPFDVIVTNPPYSAEHPQRLLEFLASCGKPWLALMPNWVYTKEYYLPSLMSSRPEAAAPLQPFYVVPRKRYNYWTPKGRRADISSGGVKAKTHGHTNAALGARTSPFISFWYCGGLPKALLKSTCAPDGCVLCWNSRQLPAGVVSQPQAQPHFKQWKQACSTGPRKKTQKGPVV
jgi:hypothetical protein